MNRLFFYVFLIVIIVACSKKAENPLQLFDKEELLCANIVNLNKDSICFPGDIEIVDSLLFILDWQNDYYLSAYSLNSGQLIKEFGKKGRGPQELSRAISIDYCRKTHSLDCFTRAPKRINSYKLNPLQFSASYSQIMMPKKGSCYHAKQYGNGFIGTGRFAHGMYAFFKKNKAIYYGDFPNFEGSDRLSLNEKSSLVQGLLKVHPLENKFVFISPFAQMLDINKLEENNFQTIKRYSFNNTKYALCANGVAAKLSTSIHSYCDVDVNENYIYCLYANVEYGQYLDNNYLGDYLLIFDWNGKPIRKYKLDKPLNKIAYDKNENSIYGLTLDEGMELVYYKLDI